MLQQLKLWLHNVAYKNRRSVRAGNHLQLPASSAQRMKKVRIKLGGENNRLLIGQNVTLHNCEIRLDGRDNLIEIGDDVRFSSGKIYLRGTRGQHIRLGAQTTVEGATCWWMRRRVSISAGIACCPRTSLSVWVTSTRSLTRSRGSDSSDRAMYGSPTGCG
ncbi:hypothetical protein [Pseudomonas fluvialis]|uniref:hypothetical protein n=1 Tax=Pseudomonas fluvialis TaxID=1793966 RepID=UPI0035B49966